MKYTNTNKTKQLEWKQFGKQKKHTNEACFPWTNEQTHKTKIKV